METGLPASGWREMVLWLLRRRRLFRVSGESMKPTLPAGAVVMIDPRAYSLRTPREDELVVANHPRQAELRIVKRVGAVIGSGRGDVHLLLSSDNAAEGSDSRAFGPVAAGHVLGKVTSRLR